MSTISGARSFQSHRKIHLTTDAYKCPCVVLPCCFVEVGSKKETGFVEKHRVEPHGEVPAIGILPRKMAADHFVGDGQKSAMVTFCAFDFRLFAHTLDPLIRTDRRVAGLASLPAFKTAGINIVTTTKERSE